MDIFGTYCFPEKIVFHLAVWYGLFFLFLKVCQTVNFYFLDYGHLSFLLFAFIYVCEGLFAMGFMWMAGHLLGVASFLPLCEFQGSSLGLQLWRESSLPTDSSWQTMNVFSSSKNYPYLLLFASTVYDLCLFFLFNYFWVYKLKILVCD